MVWYNPATWFSASTDDTALPTTDPYAVDQAPPAFGGKRRRTRRGGKKSRHARSGSRLTHSRVGRKSSRLA